MRKEMSTEQFDVQMKTELIERTAGIQQHSHRPDSRPTASNCIQYFSSMRLQMIFEFLSKSMRETFQEFFSSASKHSHFDNSPFDATCFCCRFNGHEHVFRLLCFCFDYPCHCSSNLNVWFSNISFQGNGPQFENHSIWRVESRWACANTNNGFMTLWIYFQTHLDNVWYFEWNMQPYRKPIAKWCRLNDIHMNGL